MDIALVVALAMVFTYTNGFHDASNAIATSVSTRALTPRVALALAATANLAGAFFGQRVAETVGTGIIDAPSGRTGLVLCAAALLGAITWNLLTWWRGMPSSSSHALIGGLGGAALAAGTGVQWEGVLQLVLLPMFLVPALGLALGYGVMKVILHVFRDASPGRVGSLFRTAQTVSATSVAFGHGMQDASKAAGVVMLALTVGGTAADPAEPMPLWVLALSACVLALGTYSGGWRIMRTLGRRIIDLDPAQGFSAESTAAVILVVATAAQAPVSSTHAITSSIIGSGATRSMRAVQWRVARNIVTTWLLTFPVAGALAAAAYVVLS